MGASSTKKAASSNQKAPNQFGKAPATSKEAPVKLALGVRIIVKTNDSYNASLGIITAKDSDKFWVLLDHTVAQDSVANVLYKPEQLEPEQKIA